MSDVGFSSAKISSFNGGITDNFIDGRPDQSQRLDNLSITENAKLLTRAGTEVAEPDAPRITGSDKRINALIAFRQLVFQIAGTRAYSVSSGVMSQPTAYNSGAVLATGDNDSLTSYAEWSNHLFLGNSDLAPIVKVWKDAAGTFRAANLGLPALASSPTVTPSLVGAVSYIYGFYYYYTYSVEGVSFAERGAVTMVQITNGHATPSSNQHDVASIPAIANTGTNNYDTSNIKVKIYRTKGNGTVLFYLGEVTNGTTTYTDTTDDSDLDTATEIYTTGGVLDDDQPPAAKYLTVVDNTLVLGHVKIDGVTYSNRALFSNRGMPYSMPSTFELDFNEAITGVSHVNIYPLIFCENSFYRIEGKRGITGSGEFIPRKVGDVGCINHQSIVQGRKGEVFFASDDGFYWSNGFDVKRVSLDLSKTTYPGFTDSATKKARITGTFHGAKNWVIWCIQREDSSDDADSLIVGHVNHMIIHPENNDELHLPFSIWSDILSVSNFTASSVLYNKADKTLYRADYRGYLLKHPDTIKTDLKIDTAVAVGSWVSRTIIYDWRSIMSLLGSSDLKKLINKVVLNADNRASLSAVISHNNDNSGIFNELAEVKAFGSIPFGDSSVFFGDDIRFNYAPLISAFRRFKNNYRRCQLTQLKVTNAYTLIDDSTDPGTATVNSSAKTVTLDTSGSTWIADCEGYYIRFSDDDYTNEFEISARTSNTVLTIVDSSGLLSDGAKDWKIYGYRKGDVFDPIDMVVQFMYLSTTQDAYRSE